MRKAELAGNKGPQASINDVETTGSRMGALAHRYRPAQALHIPAPIERETNYTPPTGETTDTPRTRHQATTAR